MKKLTLLAATFAVLTPYPLAPMHTVNAQQTNVSRQASPAPATAPQLPWMKESVEKFERELVAKHGAGQRERAARGLKQVASFWRAEDGGAAEFGEFARTHFAGDAATLDQMFARFERNLEMLGGHMNEVGRQFRTQSDLDAGAILPFDELFAGYDPAAHVFEDFFRNKLAFVVLLNFPLTTLEQKIAEGDKWSRRQWAETRLAQRFSKRVPASVNQANAEAASEVARYIAEYNVWMHHVMDDKGARLFPAKTRLLSHWNLRDQIKADYADAQNGVAKQRLMQRVMERIVTQTIPAAVVNNPRVDWNPMTNEVRTSTVKDYDEALTPAPAGNASALNVPEPDTRYAKLLTAFRAARLLDPYSPTAPTHVARSFNEYREIPEPRVRAMLEGVLSSPLVPRVAKLIEARLNRKLEPFDIWYNGFRPRGAYTEAQLDEIVAKKYPTTEAFERDIPNILTKLGFARERAEFVARHVAVDPARGSGHAMGASMRGAKARLRTRVEKSGMNYKGYNIAVHELGHNVEQTFSLNNVDHTLLQGVPNNAFTEALAFVFQARDLQLLGLAAPDAESRALNTLNDFWGTYEIAGVGLVDANVWRWMYEHPEATPAQLKEATLQIARDVWNKYYAPVFGQRDVTLLAIYSHMIDSFLYLPDYSIGHMIAHQIEEHMEHAGEGKLGAEFERMSVTGNIIPDSWMRKATGAPVGPEAMLAATERALAQMAKSPAR